MFLDKILRNLSLELTQTEQGQQQFAHYHEMTKTRGWKVYQSIVVAVANAMAQHMVSETFTTQSASDKDREQWAIYLSKEVIEFLLDPVKHSRFKQAVDIHNQVMEATLSHRKRETGGATRKEKK